MYVNITTLLKLKNPLTLPLLLALKQASKKDMSEQISILVTSDEDLYTLEIEGYIMYIKGKNSDSNLKRMRLGKKGTAFLNELDEPEVESQP